MMKTENVILAAGDTQTLNVAGKWFRVRKLLGGPAPKLSVKATSTNGAKQLADGLSCYDGDLVAWDDVSFRDLTFTNPTGVDVTFEVVISDEGRHQVVSLARTAGIDVGADQVATLADMTIATTATEVQAFSGLPATFIGIRKAVFQADASNPGPVRVGGADVGAAAGLLLGPGESMAWEASNSAYFYNPNGTACVIHGLVYYYDGL